METINGCTVIPASDGVDHVSFGPLETNQAYVALVGMFPPGEPAPPFHLHPHTDEAFYVAEGTITFLLGGRQLEVADGGFVFIPRNMPHTAWNSGEGPVRGLLVISPGNAEHVFVPSEAP